MGRLNHHFIDDDDVEVHPSEFPFESNYESVPNQYTTPIKLIDDYEVDHQLELLHSYHEVNILDIDLQMLQD